MTTPLQTLLAAHPRAVAAIGLRPDHTKYTIATKVRDYANTNDVGDFAFDSIETLLGLIESKAAAEAPLSDAEIEGMKLEQPSKCCVLLRDTQKEIRVYMRNGFDADMLVAAFNARLLRLAVEIKRLRGGGK